MSEEGTDGLLHPHANVRRKTGEEDIDRATNEVSGDESGVGRLMRLLPQVLGQDFDDTNMSWEEIGLSSMTQAELSVLVEEHMHVKLPFNFPDRIKSPAELIDLILAQSDRSFPVQLTDVPVDPAQALTMKAVVPMQGMLICVLLLILFLALVSSFAVSRRFVSLTEKTLYYAVFGAFPFYLPTFIMSLSLMVICAKWLVVGKYQEGQIQVYSPVYLRWWAIDRLVHLWESWVGFLVVETPLIWMFYWLLGSKIHPRTKIDAFIREFDLVEIGCDTSIKHSIKCRRFGPWIDNGRPTLRFRRLQVGSSCLVEGMDSLGSKVANGVHVDKLSVLAEGARVGAKTHAVGNPAFDGGKLDTCSQVTWMLHSLQALWLLLELHVFSALLVLGNTTWVWLQDNSWRYSALAYAILSLLSASFLSLQLSAILKRMMIGARKADVTLKTSSSLWVTFSEWACDYHFRTATSVFYVVSALSRVWNILLMLHGLDIDMRSGIGDVTCCPPSVVNQLTVRRSYFSSCLSFCSGNKIEIIDSTVGYRAVLSGGIKVHRSTVRPHGNVQDSVFDDNSHPMDITVKSMILDEFTSILFFVMLFFSFVLPYEAYLMAASLGGGRFHWMVLGVVSSVVVWFLTWFVLALSTQGVKILFSGHRSSIPDLANCLHRLLIQVMWFNCNTWGHWFLVWGTPFFNTLARGMGATIEGDLFFNGRTAHEFHALSFQDKTVVDECMIMGHVQLGNMTTTEPSRHGGVLHEGCFTFAGSHCLGSPTTEYGPLRPIFGEC